MRYTDVYISGVCSCGCVNKGWRLISQCIMRCICFKHLLSQKKVTFKIKNRNKNELYIGVLVEYHSQGISECVIFVVHDKGCVEL
jgi:hypothetical protein